MQKLERGMDSQGRIIGGDIWGINMALWILELEKWARSLPSEEGVFLVSDMGFFLRRFRSLSFLFVLITFLPIHESHFLLFNSAQSRYFCWVTNLYLSLIHEKEGGCYLSCILISARDITLEGLECDEFLFLRSQSHLVHFKFFIWLSKEWTHRSNWFAWSRKKKYLLPLSSTNMTGVA